MVKVFQFPYTKRLRTGEMKLDTGNDPEDYTEEGLVLLSKSELINEVLPYYKEQIHNLREQNKLLQKQVTLLEERVEELEEKLDEEEKDDNTPDFKPSTDPPDEDSPNPGRKKGHQGNSRGTPQQVDEEKTLDPGHCPH